MFRMNSESLGSHPFSTGKSLLPQEGHEMPGDTPLSMSTVLASFQDLFSRHLEQALTTLTEQHVLQCLPQLHTSVSPLMARYHDVLRYTLLSPGKRFRPFLAYSVAQALRASQEGLEYALHFGIALESVHAFSLAHDDLPCMDNDDLRRGLPTVHKQFSDWEALLAGDTLQTFALHHILHQESMPIGLRLWGGQTLTTAMIGPGLIEGQYFDMSLGKVPSSTELLSSEALYGVQTLEWIHRMKTGALIEASVMLGVASGLWPKEAETHPVAKLFHQWGRCLGLLFQLSDDILDCTQSTASLGKTAGKDEAQNKWTYVKVLGLEQAKAYQETLLEEAQACLNTLQHQYALDTLELLYQLTTFVARRTQ
ncbi:MAG: polyprenyl synthetase family protein [Vampirovibrionales bacterium]